MDRNTFVPPNIDEFLGIDPASNDEWLKWFTSDAIDSFSRWNPTDGPYRIQPMLDSDEGLDFIEAEALIRVKLVEIERDGLGRRQPRVLSRSELMDSLTEKFTSLIDPYVDEIIERADTLGVTSALPRTFHDDMRRYVLKQFRRLKPTEIAAAERRGDPGVDVEEFAASDPEAVASEDADVRKIHNSIKRAAE